MTTKKLSRKELKREDEFLSFSSRAVLYIRENSKTFEYAVTGIVIIVLAYIALNSYFGYVGKKGQTAYNEAFYAMAQSDALKEDPKNLKTAEESFKKVIDEYSGYNAGRLAYPELAHIKFMDKKYDEAIPLYMEYLQKTGATGPYRSLAMLALAGCYEGKGDMDKATDMLTKIAANPEDGSAELATLSLARVYRAAGQKDRSTQTLKEFAEKFKTSPFLPLVKAQLDRDVS